MRGECLRRRRGRRVRFAARRRVDREQYRNVGRHAGKRSRDQPYSKAETMTYIIAPVRDWTRVALLALPALSALPARGETVVATGQMNVEPLSDTSIRIRKMVVAGQGFKYGTFVWDPIGNAYKLSGTLKSDDAYFGRIELWRKYGTQLTAQSEALSIFAGGIGVQSAKFTSPLGATYACTSDGSDFGFSIFQCGSGELAVGQTQFGNGRYVLTFTLQGGGTATRSYYVSGGYPASLSITFPTNASANISTTPTLQWSAIGAAGYDVIIREASSGKTVYEKGVNNSIATIISLVVPPARLLRNTSYRLTIEALAAQINGGAKGIKREAVFTTAP